MKLILILFTLALFLNCSEQNIKPKTEDSCCSKIAHMLAFKTISDRNLKPTTKLYFELYNLYYYTCINQPKTK